LAQQLQRKSSSDESADQNTLKERGREMTTLSAIIGWIIFGIIVGAIARLVMPGHHPIGVVMTIILGVVGSFVGGMIAWLFTGGPERPYSPAGWILSVIGAIIVLWIATRVARAPGSST